MFRRVIPTWFAPLALWVAACASLLAPVPTTAAPDPAAMAALREKHASLAEQLRQNAFQRPLYLESSESARGLRGDIYAVVDHPFAAVDTALNGPAHWCEAMMLHLNNRRCVVDSQGNTLTLSIARRFDHTVDQAFKLAFAYRVLVNMPGYFAVELNAENGPFGTSNHHIVLEATALPGEHSFLHFAYAYDSSFLSQLGMKAYLATFGHNKVGFTVLPLQPLSGTGATAGNKEPNYIRGMRGLMERNAMRYYLAIDTYLSTVNTPPAEQWDKRLQSWFTAVEQYPRQLHETDRSTYLSLKRTDLQNAAPAP